MDPYLELETLGILKVTRLPAELAWLTDEHKHFLLSLHFAGEEGVHKREVVKFGKKNPDAVFQLEVHNLVQWLSDRAGKPMFMALSWQGDEVAQLLLSIAKNESRKRPTADTPSAASPAPTPPSTPEVSATPT